MINEILKILEENTVLDKDLNRIIKMDYPYKETLACELDDLFAKRIVNRSKPSKDEQVLSDEETDLLLTAHYQTVVDIDKALDYEQSIEDE